MPEVAGVELELLLEPAGLLRPEGERVQAAGESLDNCEKFERAEGLEQERVGSRSVPVLPARDVGTREENDGDVLGTRPDFSSRQKARPSPSGSLTSKTITSGLAARIEERAVAIPPARAARGDGFERGA